MSYCKEIHAIEQLGLPPLVTNIPVMIDGESEPIQHTMPVSGELMPILETHCHSIREQLHRDDGLQEMNSTGSILPLYFTMIGPDDLAVVGWVSKTQELCVAPIRKIMMASESD